MKRKEWEQLKNAPEAELQATVEREREKIRVYRFDLAAGKLKDIQQLRNAKKLIARALTLLQSRKTSSVAK